MKKTLLYYMVCLVGAVSLFACSDWFDVNPKTDVKSDDLFDTEVGFQSALAGIYISMTDNQVYGGDLSFGLLDQLAQLYDMIPDQVQDKSTIYQYEVETVGYMTKSRLASAWKKGYNLIANANNLMKWIDKNGERVIRDPQTRAMFKGEALAIRAYVHFDLLRGWGPMYGSEPDALSIPYRIVADNSKQPLLPARQVVQKILEDLKSAKELLSYESDLSLASFTGQERRFRFNYHAVNALMARVYCYAGDTENAVRSAREVVDHCNLELQISNQEDPVLFSEAICALNMYKMQERLSTRFSEGPKFVGHYFCKISTLNALFGITGTETEDIRAKSSAFIRYSDQERAISRKYIKNTEGVVPLIRLPEMYYILCEMSPLKEAASFLNMVRQKRGYSESADVKFNNDEERIRALDLEYRKEFYAEGQYFFFLKRHAFTTFNNCPIENFGKPQYVFPLPDAEKEYGWTPPSENEENGSDNQ
ncbi:RagB/SusD family nutrient uptake outer membrane protein [uncultured Bacteroides sp.]|uniref:RagB/SusD family nutrient uptake outer membrane protein n=1 Tax=uncultured Bacteroides sp. TaxID=162156 RepID=UPI0027DB4582|nr:RagB/SusD family nutrient uptake outer membrane protein [uncultured Bacteroides sp.]